MKTPPPNSHPPLEGAAHRPRDHAARMAGIFLLLTAAATVVMVFARISADADQPTLAESLFAIANNRAMYGVSGAARILSGVTLMAAAWYLLRTWIIRERLATPLVPALFLVSGIVTVVSGASAIALAASVSNASDTAILSTVDTSTETIDLLRWLTGKIGFTLMGLALIVATPYLWRAGGFLRYISVLSAAVGISMQFIWFDSATVMHQISGNAIFIWLVVIGVLLLTGRIEQRFAVRRGSSLPAQ